MDNYEKARELLNKHLNIHGGESLGITEDEALQIHDVVGQKALDAVEKTINLCFEQKERLLLDFLIYLEGNNLINDYDFEYEKEINKFLKKYDTNRRSN